MSEMMPLEYEPSVDILPEQLEHILRLDITPGKLHRIDHKLGPNGPGSFLLRSVLDERQIDLLHEEVFDPERVTHRDNHYVGPHKRHGTLVENHSVFALKLLQGDQSMVEKVPRMQALANNVEYFIRSLSVYFPSLEWYVADEMSLHRYDDQKVGLSFHKDNARFYGLVAIVTLEGQRDFQTMDRSGRIETTTVREGDLHLTRVNGLYEPTGFTSNICPDHAVVNLKTPYSTSFIVRANTLPNELVPGFTYDNWGQATYRYPLDLAA